jgi:hypothetical protein
MYTLKDSNDVPGRKTLCQVGYPENMTPDLCIIDTDNPYTSLSINSKVLREALLSDPGFVLFTLGLKVEDANKGRNIR